MRWERTRTNTRDTRTYGGSDPNTIQGIHHSLTPLANPARRRAYHRESRDLVQRPFSSAVQFERCGESRDGELVDAHRPREWILTHAGDCGPRSKHNPRLRSAEKLIPAH